MFGLVAEAIEQYLRHGAGGDHVGPVDHAHAHVLARGRVGSHGAGTQESGTTECKNTAADQSFHGGILGRSLLSVPASDASVMSRYAVEGGRKRTAATSSCTAATCALVCRWQVAYQRSHATRHPSAFHVPGFLLSADAGILGDWFHFGDRAAAGGQPLSRRAVPLACAERRRWAGIGQQWHVAQRRRGAGAAEEGRDVIGGRRLRTAEVRRPGTGTLAAPPGSRRRDPRRDRHR
ncbi:hypothetical protein D3C78_1025340 [compost metagenome]